VTVEHRPKVLTIAKMPTPIPHTPPPPAPPKQTPHPAANPRAQGKPAPVARVPSIHGTLPSGGKNGAAPTAAPTPVATAVSTPGCAKGDLPASIVATPAPADIPASVRASGTSGVARVQVKLDTNGAVTSAAVVQSTGNTSLDLVALTMAKSAQYAPAQHDCKAVASDYTFSARFISW
jgi:TonB family protein